jgi:hypothetical protein
MVFDSAVDLRATFVLDADKTHASTRVNDKGGAHVQGAVKITSESPFAALAHD